MSTTPPFQEEYTLSPGESNVIITITNPGSYFVVHDSSEHSTTINYGTIGESNTELKFTLYSTVQYVAAQIETQYVPTTSPVVDPPSYCHIYFKPGGSNWQWATDAQTSDNPSIFPNGQGQRTDANINIQRPTEVNPQGIRTNYPCLNSTLVFLLDKNSNGNLLFRGNEPLIPAMTNQHIDFHTLHTSLKSKYEAQTEKFDFPEMGKYVLRDIAFLSPDPKDEGGILLAEIGSFGATKTSQVDQQWYPTSPATLPNTTMIGQVANWNVEPTTPALDLNVEMVKKLKTWMNTPSTFTDDKGNTIPVVYYIHCSSGHDRTGMISSAYTSHQYGMDVSKGFILGTTIHKLSIPGGGNLVQDCDNVGTSTVDTDRSRCFVAGNGTTSNFNSTVVAIYNQINNASVTALSATAVSGDPAIDNTGTAYVYDYYPWNT